MRFFLPLLALGLFAQETDVVALKDGTTRTGIIVSESSLEVVLETLIKGSKGEVIGRGRVTIQKADITRIDRASEEARKKASDRGKSFGDRGRRRAESLAAIVPAPAEFDGEKGLRTTGSWFELQSTCDPATVKDVTLCLNEIFAGYRKFFEVTRNSDRKLKVYFFSSRAEYDRFQQKTYGGAVLNPAFFDPRKNHIAAFDCVQKEEERRIRKEILEAERALQGFQADISAEESRITQAAKQYRQNILDAAAAKKAEVQRDGAGNKDARLREVDKWKDEKFDELKKIEKDLQKQLEDYRQKAGDQMAKNRRVIESNYRILFNQNKAMYETLFHESFHAFAANYLWQGSDRKEFPRWLHEGMASYFEVSVVEGDDLVHGSPNPQFLKICVERLPTNMFVPLADILRGEGDKYAVVHVSETGRAGLYYAQSWALVHYLSTRVSREQIAAYVTDVLSGKDNVKAFEAMAGKPCAQIEADVRKHLESLK